MLLYEQIVGHLSIECQCFRKGDGNAKWNMGKIAMSMIYIFCSVQTFTSFQHTAKGKKAIEQKEKKKVSSDSSNGAARVYGFKSLKAHPSNSTQKGSRIR